eukprot:scaffold1201_cov413-Prasinococcus_capsulatus_cf.AAC.7
MGRRQRASLVVGAMRSSAGRPRGGSLTTARAKAGAGAGPARRGAWRGRPAFCLGVGCIRRNHEGALGPAGAAAAAPAPLAWPPPRMACYMHTMIKNRSIPVARGSPATAYAGDGLARLTPPSASPR